jgi:site-specific DNA recombinase
MQAIGYIRVSTEEQATGGSSLPAQRERIELWCKLQQHELAHVYVDAGLSGKRADNRPGLQSALADVCKRRGALIVYSLSRMARSKPDAYRILERLSKAGGNLVSLTENLDTTTAGGKLIFGIFSVIAQFESEQIGERVKGTMSYLRTQRRRISRHVPFGFDCADSRTLVPNPVEQAAIATIRQLRAQGASLREIAAELTVRGMASKSGRPWTAKVLKTILDRKAA